MATVNTVLGPIDADDLGFTLSHEHIATGSAGMHHTYPEFFDLDGTIEDAVVALKQAYTEGVRSYIDASTFDIGRDTGTQVSRIYDSPFPFDGKLDRVVIKLTD